jgi:hypothetical protein
MGQCGGAREWGDRRIFYFFIFSPRVQSDCVVLSRLVFEHIEIYLDESAPMELKKLNFIWQTFWQ